MQRLKLDSSVDKGDEDAPPPVGVETEEWKLESNILKHTYTHNQASDILVQTAELSMSEINSQTSAMFSVQSFNYAKCWLLCKKKLQRNFTWKNSSFLLLNLKVLTKTTLAICHY